MVIETEKLILGWLVAFKFLFELDGVATFWDVAWATVVAVSILGDEGVDVDTSLTVMDFLSVVLAAAVMALQLVLFDVNQDIIRETHMNESVDSTTVRL